MSDNNSSSSGIGVLGLLGVLFVGLKLGGVIDWSWWYVTMPFWGGIALVCGITFFAFAMVAAISLYEYMTGQR